MNEIVAEARSWIGTPYRAHAGVKGAGADCVMFPIAVYRSLGIADIEPPAKYPVQWHLHHDDERYLEIVAAICDEVEHPQPGDFVLWRFGKAFSHGGIVAEWPRVIHAHFRAGVTEDDVSACTLFHNGVTGEMRPHKFFRMR